MRLEVLQFSSIFVRKKTYFKDQELNSGHLLTFIDIFIFLYRFSIHSIGFVLLFCIAFVFTYDADISHIRTQGFNINSFEANA